MAMSRHERDKPIVPASSPTRRATEGLRNFPPRAPEGPLSSDDVPEEFSSCQREGVTTSTRGDDWAFKIWRNSQELWMRRGGLPLFMRL
jgi:hypothetical protein